MATPFLIFGDAPDQPTGLSRILGDLATRIHANREALDLEVVTCGYAPWVGLPQQGQPAPALHDSYRRWVFNDFASRGAQALHAAYRYYFGIRPGIVFSVWDPARVAAVSSAQLPIKRWGYFPVDAMTPTSRITGPAGSCLDT